MKRKIVAIVQSRLGSTRLPNKTLMPLGSLTVAERIFANLSECRMLDKVVLAIPATKSDDELAVFLSKKRIPFSRGSSENLVERHLTTAASEGAGFIVRVPGDNPFVDPEEVDRVISFHLEHNISGFTSNLSPFLDSAYPDGIGGEIFSYQILEKYSKGKSGVFLEHPHLNFVNYQTGEQMIEDVSVMTPKCPTEKACRKLRLDLNTEKDLLFLRRVVSEVGDSPSTSEIVLWFNSLKESERLFYAAV
jgi:spore coat polysaccharide biosynthesis protein SpsF